MSMTKFLVTYHGGSAPSNRDEAAKMQEAFGKWLASAGDAVIDPGAPLRASRQVSNGHASPVAEIGGYSVIEAEDIDRAVAILRTHPFVARGGTLQLHEAVVI